MDRQKRVLFILLLVFGAKISSAAEDDSTIKSLKKELIHSGGIYKGCSGSKIIFKRFRKFEYIKLCHPDLSTSHSYRGCRDVIYGQEVSVYFGKWNVRNDTVYITVRRHRIYNAYKYKRLQDYRRYFNLRPFRKSVCKFRAQEVYIYSDGNCDCVSGCRLLNY